MAVAERRREVARGEQRLESAGVLRSGLVVTAPLLFWLSAALVLSTPTPFLVIASGSMSPEYSSGDLIVVRGLRHEKVVLGDVIVFRSPRGGDPNLYVHRVVELVTKDERWYVRTKGDGSAYANSWLVPAEKIVGKVVLCIPGLGRAKVLAARHFPLIVSILAGLNIAYFALAERIRNHAKRAPAG